MVIARPIQARDMNMPAVKAERSKYNYSAQDMRVQCGQLAALGERQTERVALEPVPREQRVGAWPHAHLHDAGESKTLTTISGYDNNEEETISVFSHHSRITDENSNVAIPRKRG